MKKLIPLISILLVSAVLLACSINPVTGKNEFLLVSAIQEVAIGEKNYLPSQQAQGGPYYIDPDVGRYVSAVGQKLAKASDRPDLPYEFVVLNNSEPNAWALPGGKIAINRGLLTHLRDESELAAVLGHEIVHAAARHSAAQMTRNTFIGAGAQVLGMAATESGYGPLANTAIQIGSAVWLAKYGRGDELESDAYGMDYMVRAGYDPQGAVRLQETFVELSKDRNSNFLNSLFASHPPSQERVDANRKKAAGMPSGKVRREQFERHIAQVRKDMPAYRAQNEALKALNEKRLKQALEHLDLAISLQPRESYFYELRGQAQKMLGQPERAEQDFSTAISRNPGFFSHYLSRGVLRFDRGNNSGARADLERSNALLPTQAANYVLGELSIQVKDMVEAQQYYQAAIQGGGELGKRAQSRYTVLELPKNPSKFIVSQPYVGKDGYLKIAVKNNAVVKVINVQIQVDEMAGSYSVARSANLSGPSHLEPGEQLIVSTLIGPFTKDQVVPVYRTNVIAAQPIEVLNAGH